MTTVLTLNLDGSFQEVRPLVVSLGAPSAGSLVGLNSFGLLDASVLPTIPVSLLVPLSGGGTTNFLRADGTWAAPTYVLPLTFTSIATGFSIAGGTISKTLIISNTLTISATDDTRSLNIGTGGTLASAAFLVAGAANGVATLDTGGHVPVGQLPTTVLGGMNYQGVWDATIAWPNGVASAANKGYYWKVSVAGTQTVNGMTQWTPGDIVVSDGVAWDKIDGITNEILAVNGKTRTVGLGLASSDFANQGTVTTVLIGNAAGNPSFGAVNLSTMASGILQAAQFPALTGDITTVAGAMATTLKATGTAGTYRSVTTDTQGRVTTGQTGEVRSVLSKTTNYTVLITDSVIFVSGSTSAVTITLPTTPAIGQSFIIKRTDNTPANLITVAGNGKNIDEAASQSMTSQYDTLEIIYDGTQWYLI
jgi:hypothetical protein